MAEFDDNKEMHKEHKKSDESKDIHKEHKTFEENKISESQFLRKIKDNPWILSTIIAGLLVIVLLFFAFRGSASVSESTAATKAVDFLNNYVVTGGGVTLNSTTENDGVYIVTVNYNGRGIPVQMTKDGKFIDFGQGIINMDSFAKSAGAIDNANQQPPQTQTEVPKSDKPVVELFVMTHCPFGTQAEKGILPIIDVLKSKADVKIRFVHYFMHGDREEQETYRQVCIRETQKDKYWKYLQCFLNASDSDACIKSTGINSASLTTCMSGKAKDYYKVDSDLSNKYGVQGSPTLVINGVQADFYPRSPSSALSVVCSAFNTQPAECSQKLSTDNPSAGFGYGAADASSAAAQCG